MGVYQAKCVSIHTFVLLVKVIFFIQLLSHTWQSKPVSQTYRPWKLFLFNTCSIVLFAGIISNEGLFSQQIQVEKKHVDVNLPCSPFIHLFLQWACVHAWYAQGVTPGTEILACRAVHHELFTAPHERWQWSITGTMRELCTVFTIGTQKSQRWLLPVEAHTSHKGC